MAQLLERRRLRWHPRLCLLLLLVVFLPASLSGVHGADAQDDDGIKAATRWPVTVREGGGHPGGGHAGGAHGHGGGGGSGGHGRPEQTRYHSGHRRRSAAPCRELAGPSMAAARALLAAAAAAFALLR